ncbi:hypothetical protein Tco_0001865 [Tanacetum coccineum]
MVRICTEDVHFYERNLFMEGLFTNTVWNMQFPSQRQLRHCPSESSDDDTNVVNAPREPFVNLLSTMHVCVLSISNDDNSSSDDDSTYGEDIEYVDASPPDVEIDSLEVVEIVDPEVWKIIRTVDLTSIDLGIRKNASTTNV